MTKTDLSYKTAGDLRSAGDPTIYLDDGYIALVFVGLFSFNRILEYEIVKKKYFI